MNKTNKNPYQQRMRILNEATNANKDEVTIFLLLAVCFKNKLQNIRATRQELI